MKSRLIFPSDAPDGLLAKRGAHFGRAKYYTTVEINDVGMILDVEAIANAGHSAGGCSNAVENIMALDADILVVQGIGAAPLEGFMKQGISVYHDTESITIGDAVKAFISRQLNVMQPQMCCSHH